MLLYNLVVRLYIVLIHLAALRGGKARQWVRGRRRWHYHLQQKMKRVGPGKRYWFHCASYGEFEQGRPLLEALRAREPDCVLVLSFFSPSGYLPFHNWPVADVVCYLPADTRRNARNFLQCVQPQTVVFVKYEFWVNFLNALRSTTTRAYLVSAVFKPHHPFFKWYGHMFRNSLKAFSHLFIQDARSGELLRSIGVTNYSVSGDTRFDRVAEIRRRFEPLALFDAFCSGRRVVVAGSTWPGDEKLLMAAFQNLRQENLCLVVAPHNVDEKHIAALKELLQAQDISFGVYTEAQYPPQAKVLVVDTIGLLARLYQYADVAYVGGGFDGGIHNCLEPAVFLKPVLFYGEGYEKFNEAVELIELQAAKNVRSAAELTTALKRYLHDDEHLEVVKKALTGYFEKNVGVTQKIMSVLSAP